MSKKYLFLFGVLFGVTNAYAEGVVLSDTYASDEEVDSELEAVFEPADSENE